MILIDAVYIHESGGKVLLEYLVNSILERNLPFHLLQDNRVDLSSLTDLKIENYTVVQSSESARAAYYRNLPGTITTIFCFANVPPPVAIKDRPVYVFFQNVLILSPLAEHNFYPFTQKILFLFKKWYIRYRNRKNYQWVVQTPTMKGNLVKGMKLSDQVISVIPFFPENEKSVLPAQQNTSKFIYVADGVPQKNHQTLLDAWDILYKNHGVSPELHLTIPKRFTKLTKRVKLLCSRGLNIINHGICDKAELAQLYNTCGYLIFPSLAESFGLPLIEAVSAGCSVLTADLPYVYDIVKPAKVFNPFNAGIIAMTVLESINEKKGTELIVSNKIDQLIEMLHN